MNPYESGAVIDMNMGHNSATPAALQSLLSFAPQLGSCDTPEPSLSAIIYRYYRTHVDDRASADAMARDYVRALADAAPQPAVQQGEPLAWMDDGTLRAGSEATAYRVVTDATKRGMTASLAASFITPLYAHPAAPAAQEDALDAARYRWLRSCNLAKHPAVRDGFELGDAHLDAAIDAAKGESNG